MSESQREFIETVLAVIAETDRSGLLTDRREDGLTGLSGMKTVGLLQRLVGLFADDRTACYLEIGVHQGLTLVSVALEAPRTRCFGIDNFATLDSEGQNLGVVHERLDRFGVRNASLLNMDFEEALERLDVHLEGHRLALYFVDGPHDYRSQMVALLQAKGRLSERAVIVIDDANYPDVRMATRDFLLGHADFRLAFEAYTSAHPANMSSEERASSEDGWLNGVHVLVRDPDGLLPPMLPPVEADRTLYRNEWLVHRLAMAELAPEAVALAGAICGDDDQAADAARATLLQRHAERAGLFDGRAPDRNTRSEGLPLARLNRL